MAIFYRDGYSVYYSVYDVPSSDTLSDSCESPYDSVSSLAVQVGPLPNVIPWIIALTNAMTFAGNFLIVLSRAPLAGSRETCLLQAFRLVFHTF